MVERLSALHGLGAVGHRLHELGYLLVLLGYLLVLLGELVDEGGGDVAAKNKAGAATPAFEPEIRIARVTG